MAWSAPYTYTTGEVVTAANLNTYLRDNVRYLKGMDGTAQIEDGIDLTGTGTQSWLRPPRLTTTQRDALIGTLQARSIYNITKDTPESYGTGWEEIPSIYGTSVQGDVVIRTSTGWDRLPANAGKFLRSDGTAANSTWADAPAGIVMVWGGTAYQQATVPIYLRLNSHDPSNTTEANTQHIAARSGTLQKLWIKVNNNTVATSTLMVRKNTADSSLLILIPGTSGAGTFCNTSDICPLVSGDLFTVKLTQGTVDNSMRIYTMSLIYE